MAEPITAWLASTAFVNSVATALAVQAATVATVMTYAAFVVSGLDASSCRARHLARASNVRGDA